MKRRSIYSIRKTLSTLLLGMFMVLGAVKVNAQISVTATAGTPGPTIYATLRAAVLAVNAGTHQGAITMAVVGNTTETALTTLNASGTGAASYTSILVKPTVVATISGNIATGILFMLGSNVTIDGAIAAGGTTRDLTIRNTNAASIYVIRIGSPSAALGASNNTIKNCNITNASTTGTTSCILSGSGVTAGQPAEFPNSNNTFQNNVVTGTQTGMFIVGPTVALDANWNITGNDFNTLGFNAVTVFYSSNLTISNNSITAITINGADPINGIELSWIINGASIFGNKISGLVNTGADGAYGIYADITTPSANVNIYNNFISNVIGAGGATGDLNGNGIYIDGGNGLKVYHNTVSLTTAPPAASINGAFTLDPFAAGAVAIGGVDLRDNILVNNQTVGTRYAIISTGAANLFSAIDYNDYVSAPNLGLMNPTPCPTIASIQTNFGGNVNSLTVNPTFVSATDLHLQPVPANNPLIAGTPVAPVTADIDGTVRSTTVPTIGAHELLSKIRYPLLPNTCSSGDIILTPDTVLSSAGVPLAGPLVTQVYFRKNAGPWFHNSAVFVSGTANNSIWTATISAAAMGGVTAGDVISYYMVAQTVGGTVFGEPSAGLTAVDVNTITTPPTTPNTYTVNAVTMSGITPSNSVCFSSAAQSVNYSYTGTTGTPNQYTLTWSPAGPTAVSAFTALPASPIAVNIPGGTGANTYTGTITVKNSTTTCTNTYTVTLVVNPVPAAITGSTGLCVGSTTTLATTSTGGTWTSSNTGVATIGPTTGVITAVAGGTTTVSYTFASGCNTTTIVNVTTPPAAITGTLKVCPGLTTTLSDATAGGTWSSLNTTVATVGSNTGIVTGGISGTATIQYTITGCGPTSAIVTVNPAPAAITGLIYACQGGTTALHDATPGGTWSSGDVSVATIGTDGVVSGVAAGSAAITYTAPVTGCITTTTVTIFVTPTITGPTPFMVCQGLTTTLTATPAGGTWSSVLPGTAFVNTTTGAVQGVTPGTTTITYMMPTGCYATGVITVNTAPSTISGNHVICTGYTMNLGNATGGGVWTSSDPTVATVGSASGIVTAISSGTVTISYTTTSCNPAMHLITVNQTPSPITGTTNLCDGGSTTTLHDATPFGVWTITGGTATISPGGVVTGLTLGSSNVVTYTTPNACFTIAPIVVDTLPAPIAGPDTLCKFSSGTFTDASPSGVWSSSPSAIASIIAATGVATGVSSGVANVTYTKVSGCYRTKPLYIREPVLASVNITRTPASDTICAGTAVTYTAVAVNGGLAPEYHWQIFGVDVPGAVTNVYSFTPTHGDVVSVFVYNSSDICAAPSPSYTQDPINVYPVGIYPHITLSTSNPTYIWDEYLHYPTYNDTVQNIGTDIYNLGKHITFNAEVTWGGLTPSYQWYSNGAPIAGANTSTLARDFYSDEQIICSITGANVCAAGGIAYSDTIFVFAKVPSGVASVGNNSSMSLFPNPNTGNFTLSGSLATPSNDALTYDVVNVLGQVVAKGTITPKNGKIEQQIDLGSDVVPGAYMLRVNAAGEPQVFHFVIGG